MDADDPKLTANPGYAAGQLAAALTTGAAHADAKTRARADAKVARWTRVLDGMFDGSLAIGGRTPVADLPAWVTLEGVKGGFATGAALAAGPLLPHEIARLGSLTRPAGATERATLNAHHLTEGGMAELRTMLETGRYRVEVPEEGALLVVAWLVAHRHTQKAHELLEEIIPYADRLRFYPVPADSALAPSTEVRLATVGEVRPALAEVRTSADVETMNETLRIWAPLSDRVVALWLETVEGDVPAVRRGEDGAPIRRATGDYQIDGGTPGVVFPEGWAARAAAVVRDYETARVDHVRSQKPVRPGESFARLREAMAQVVAKPGTLSARDRGMIRRLLAGVLVKRGAPGSEKLQALRAEQAKQAAAPTNGELAGVLVKRLERTSGNRGLASLDPYLAPVTDDEAARMRVPAGYPLPSHLRDKLARCLEAPVEVLVQLGVIPSGEVLALVVPQITSQVRAAGLVMPELQSVFRAIYAAFRRRRSLLLLDLSKQVALEELPWVGALETFRTDDLGGRAEARQTLDELALLTIGSFPHVIIPNKLLQELRALVKGAGLEVPFVDELAADIFMGTFSSKFLEAAQIAGRMLKDTLYERYYGLDYRAVLAMGIPAAPRKSGAHLAPDFARVCHELAGASAGGRGGSVARNGTIIEQQQILTTQNLATVFEAVGLAERFGPRLAELAWHCFTWICEQQQLQVEDWRSRLQLVKNCAYAWRQMLFYLSVGPRAEIGRFLGRARQHLEGEDEVFAACFAPALDGLEAVAQGGSFDRDGHLGSGRRLLGWTTSKHWLLA